MTAEKTFTLTQSKLDRIIARRVAETKARLQPQIEMTAVLHEALGEAVARINVLEHELAAAHEVTPTRTTKRDLTAAVADRVAARLAEAA
jgi:hypothetical protein